MFASILEGTQVGRYHSWVVDEASLPGCWNLVARDEEGNVMVVVRKDKPWTGSLGPDFALAGMKSRLFWPKVFQLNQRDVLDEIVLK